MIDLSVLWSPEASDRVLVMRITDVAAADVDRLGNIQPTSPVLDIYARMGPNYAYTEYATMRYTVYKATMPLYCVMLDSRNKKQYRYLVWKYCNEAIIYRLLCFVLLLKYGLCINYNF